jgi:hypothetical protein
LDDVNAIRGRVFHRLPSEGRPGTEDDLASRADKPESSPALATKAALAFLKIGENRGKWDVFCKKRVLNRRQFPPAQAFEPLKVPAPIEYNPSSAITQFQLSSSRRVRRG